MGHIKISPAEMELMEILWAENQWTSIPRVAEKTEGKWKYTTVSTFLTRLKAKGFLKSRKQGGVNEFLPKLTREEYQARETQQFIDEIYGGSAKDLIASLCEGRISGSDYNELMRWLEEIE